jgi:hypothetical protein
VLTARRSLAFTLCCAVSAPGALAETGIDTFRIVHQAGPCATAHFASRHFLWTNRPSIPVATDETVAVVLYGHGMELATDASGSGILAWIDATGRSANYPGAPVVDGARALKGYVTVALRAEQRHGTGERSVLVTWPTGTATVAVSVFGTCRELRGTPYRINANGS